MATIRAARANVLSRCSDPSESTSCSLGSIEGFCVVVLNPGAHVRLSVASL